MDYLEGTTGVDKGILFTAFLGIIGWVIKEVIGNIKSQRQSKKDKEDKKETWTATKTIDTYQELRKVVVEYDIEVEKIIKYVKRFDSKYDNFFDYHDKVVELVESKIPLLIRRVQESSILVPNIEKEFNNVLIFYNGLLIMVSEKYSKDYKGVISPLFKKAIFNYEGLQGNPALLNNFFTVFLQDDMQAINDCYEEHQKLLNQLLDEIKKNMQKYKLD